MPTRDTETITAWKSKGMSDESIKLPTTPSNSVASKLKRIHNSIWAVEFKGSWLKQDKATFAQKDLINCLSSMN